VCVVQAIGDRQTSCLQLVGWGDGNEAEGAGGKNKIGASAPYSTSCELELLMKGAEPKPAGAFLQRLWRDLCRQGVTAVQHWLVWWHGHTILLARRRYAFTRYASVELFAAYVYFVHQDFHPTSLGLTSTSSPFSRMVWRWTSRRSGFLMSSASSSLL